MRQALLRWIIRSGIVWGLAMIATDMGADEMVRMYIASAGDRPAILTCTLDLATGTFGPAETVAGDVRTGFLALHPAQPVLYAATVEPKVGEADGNNGAVRAYRIERPDGTLRLLNKAPTHDNGTTHLAVDHQARAVVVCHYGGNGTSAIPLGPRGRLSQSVSQIVHAGSSVHPQRQTRPHPHGVAIDLAGRFVFVADLGSDRVEVFWLDQQTVLSRHAFWKAAAGAGPRHVTFHPTGRWLYCINELDSTISVLQFDARQGKLAEVETISTLPKGWKGKSTTAEVVVHPGGRFLYGSNRGHDSTAVFAIDPDDGTLALVEHEPTQGQHPRFVGLDPSGRIYVAANLHSDRLVAFRIDAESGALEATGQQLAVPRPMCVVFTSN